MWLNFVPTSRLLRNMRAGGSDWLSCHGGVNWNIPLSAGVISTEGKGGLLIMKA